MLEQYKEAIEKSNIISKTDINGIITFVNDEFCKISGYAKEELIGKNHNIVRHPDVPASAFKALWETIKAKKPIKLRSKTEQKTGQLFMSIPLSFLYLMKKTILKSLSRFVMM